MGPVLEDSYVDVVERLFREFEGHHLLSVISDVVAECRDQLKGETPITAFPEVGYPFNCPRLLSYVAGSTPRWRRS